MKYIEILFWRIAQKLIRKGYGANCPDFAEECYGCGAKKVIEWIEEHIEIMKM